MLPVLARLDASLHVLFTTGTVTSARLLAQRLPELGLDHRVTHRFVPLDVPRWVARFLAHWRPDAAAFVERELWPNLLAACRARQIPRARQRADVRRAASRDGGALPGFARPMLGGFACVQARSAADAERLRRLGAANVTAPGDLKFAADDLPADPDAAGPPARALPAARSGSRPAPIRARRRWPPASMPPWRPRIPAC